MFDGKRFVVIPILYMLFIFILSSIPVSEDDKIGGLIYIYPMVQNFLHIPLYGVLLFLWVMFFRNIKVMLTKAVLYSFTIAVSYSFFDEFYQSVIPGRCASLIDILLDITGCLAGVLFYRLIDMQFGPV